MDKSAASVTLRYPVTHMSRMMKLPGRDLMRLICPCAGACGCRSILSLHPLTQSRPLRLAVSRECNGQCHHHWNCNVHGRANNIRSRTAQHQINEQISERKREMLHSARLSGNLQAQVCMSDRSLRPWVTKICAVPGAPSHRPLQHCVNCEGANPCKVGSPSSQPLHSNGN